MPVLLDRETGRPEQPSALLAPSGLPFYVEDNMKAGWSQPRFDGEMPDFSRLPQSVLDNLEKARKADFSKGAPFMASGNNWRQLEGVIVTDPTALTAAAEAIMVPDILLSVPRVGAKTPGITFEYTLWGSLSMAVTTPGNFIMRLRWGGVAGVLLVTSATIAPTGTQVITTASFRLTYVTTIRTEPSLTTATSWTQGEFWCPGTLETTPASTTIIVTHLKATQIPPTGAAVSGSMDVSVAKALSPTYQPSLTTASLVTHLATVESYN